MDFSSQFFVGNFGEDLQVLFLRGTCSESLNSDFETTAASTEADN
jgi:hypothetical protein